MANWNSDAIAAAGRNFAHSPVGMGSIVAFRTPRPAAGADRAGAPLYARGHWALNGGAGNERMAT